MYAVIPDITVYNTGNTQIHTDTPYRNTFITINVNVYIVYQMKRILLSNMINLLCFLVDVVLLQLSKPER